MKTVISVPDALFERIERRSEELGLNWSEFFTQAATRFLEELQLGDPPRTAAESPVTADRTERSLPDGRGGYSLRPFAELP
jgi:metal-responsive CopG/Arc/MetJ family transcriptional regulator